MAGPTSDSATLPHGVRASLPRAAWLFVLTVAVAAAVVVGLYLPGAARELRGGAWPDLWPPLLYAAGLVVAERFVVKVPLRHHRFSVGVCDMVIVLGVVFIKTPVLVLATGLGIAVSQGLFEPQPVKRLFNVPQYVLSVAVAAVVTSGLVKLLDRSELFGAQLQTDLASSFRPALAVVWVLGMAAFFLVNHSLVSMVVSLSVGRGFVQSWLRAAPVAAADWAASTAYGLVIAALLVNDQALLPLLVVPIGLTFLGNRAWARSLAQGQRMHSLYAAGRALSNRLGDAGAWQTFAQQVAGVLNCEGAAVFLGRAEDGALDVIATGHTERLTVAPSPSAWEQAAKGYAARAGWPRYTMVPMEAEGGRVVGYAAAYGPRVDADFAGDDAETLLTLANQGAVALVNEELYHEAESERAALRDIVGHSTDGIYTVGPDRTVSSWNAAMVALTGYQEDEAVGQKCFNLLRARDGDGVDMCAADCPILAAAKSGHEEVRDASVLNKEGLARWIRYAHAPIIGGDGAMDVDVVVVRDVTRERQTDELKADFVASVSHELRTPLTPIKGFLMTLLREDRDFAQDRRREYYKLMLMQAQRLERLIEDLLEVTRLEAGAGLVDATAIDAVDLVRQVVDRFTSEDAERVVHVVAPDHAVYCRGDWMRIDQVLGNLLSNAMRYAPPHEPVEVRLAPQGREVVFEVRDWGPGIPIDEQSRIFERFHRVGHYMTREPGGAGLGLYLAKRLVEAMGGRIWVSSRLGHGSVFSFALPSEPSLNVVAAPRGRHIGEALSTRAPFVGAARRAAHQRKEAWVQRRVIIVGAAGRDFHNFNSAFRDDRTSVVVAFTATQIPYIDDRIYPPALAGPAYPAGIPIFPEDRLEDLIASHHVDEVVFSYSDVRHIDVMHVASRVLAAGADFRLLGPNQTELAAKVPVVAVCAVRTGAGKSQTTRRVAEILRRAGRRVVAVRHPMPYGDLASQAVQRFATREDLVAARPTIEEREEYEPHLAAGTVVYAGVDYQAILEQAQAEAEVLLWDGGNNDLPFFRPDLHIVVADPLRGGHESSYHPGEANVRAADVVVINKVDEATPEQVAALEEQLKHLNPDAVVVKAASPVRVEDPDLVRGKRVLVIEDGPTLTHGEMSYGAGVVAARRLGAAEIVDPRPWLVGSLAEVYERYPHIGALVPAMGYSDAQIRELETVVNRAPVDAVVIGTPIDLRRVANITHPATRVSYDLVEQGQPDLAAVLAPIIRASARGEEPPR